MYQKLFLIISAALLLCACSTTKHTISTCGRFVGQSFWSEDPLDISLNKDNTFKLNWAKNNYTGTWQFTAKNRIILMFDTIAVPNILLGSGSINEDNLTIQLINKNKIKLDGDLLKRIE